MRRAFLAALLAAAALAPPGHAAPAPIIVDLTGDTPVAGYDLVSARLYGTLAGRKPMLRAELRLAAAPSAPVEYVFGFVAGCDMYMFRYSWTGVAAQSSGGFDHWDYCQRELTSVPDATFPTGVTVRGTTLSWQVPYVLGVRRGTKATQPFAGSCVKTQCAVPVADMAESNRTHVVGSDLPRR